MSKIISKAINEYALINRVSPIFMYISVKKSTENLKFNQQNKQIQAFHEFEIIQKL